MAGKDFYRLLGVDKSAKPEEIKKAYRKLAKQFHPDVNPGNKAAEDKFKEITEAYAVLSDTEKRRQYDTVGPEGFQSGFDYSQFFRGGFRPGAGGRTYQYSTGPGAGFDFDISGLEDIFGSLFGGGRGFQSTQFEAPDRETMYQMEVDFLTAAKGGEIELALEGDRLRVKIPPGVDTGQKIRLAGKGEKRRKGGRSDLYLSLVVRPHHEFQRQGDDVLIDIPVSMAEAALGAKIEVPTIDGRTEMKLPAGTSSGQKLRLRGKGIYRQDRGRGDQYVRVEIVVPKNIDAKSAELLKEFDKRNPISARK